MASKSIIEGRLTKDPELSFTPNGKALCKLSVADNEKQGEQEVVHFFDITVWGVGAEGAAEHLRKGDSIQASCNVRQEKWQDKESGKDRNKVVFSAYLIHKACWPAKEGAGSRATPKPKSAAPTSRPAAAVDDAPF